MGQQRNAVITINNYTPDEEEQLRTWPGATFIAYGCEEAPSTGTPHLHCYVEFKTPVRFETIKKKFPRARIEMRKGTAQQALDYVVKEGATFKRGEISKQGNRSDLDAVVKAVQEGKRARAIAREHPIQHIKFHRGIASLIRHHIEPRDEDTPRNIQVFWGSTGTGKSKSARDVLGRDDLWVWNPGMEKWFDGYEGQKNVIFEEFRSQMSIGNLLTITDRYNCQQPTKGGFCDFVADNIIFTSAAHPSNWYHEWDDKDRYDQLQRRITKTVHFSDPLNVKKHDQASPFLDNIFPKETPWGV